MKIMLVRDRNVLNNNWLLYFAELLYLNGHEISIACDTYNKFGHVALGHELPEAVRIINLNAPTNNVLINIWRKCRGKLFPAWFRFNKLIKKEKPDVLICYFPIDLFNVTRFQKHNIPIIQMVHNYPPMLFNKYCKRMQFNKIRKNSFEQVSCFQVLMSSHISKLKQYFPNKCVTAIGNIVRQYKADDIANLTIEKHNIVYVARVEKANKRPHLLVDAFAKIAEDFPDWKVEIWGARKYPEYDKEINDFITKHNLENQVFLKGYTEDVESVYRHADINAFPSACEGFGLGLADGMAQGLPAIGFSEAYSVNEIIIDGHNGFLAKDVDDFAAKLKILMQDKALRIRLGKNAHEDMKAYAPEIIMQKWEELLNKVTSDKK